MTKLLWLALPPLLLAGCTNAANEQAADNGLDGNMANGGEMANSGGSMANAGSMAPVNAAAAQGPVTDTPTYLAKAGAGDLFEIDSSKAILGKTSNAAIKAFAQMMIDNHSQSTAKVKAAAEAAKLPIAPPALEPAQQQMLDGIKAASGAAADTAYLEAQRTAHEQALALHQSYASGGETEQLRKAASEIAPVVQKHIEELGKLKAG